MNKNKSVRRLISHHLMRLSPHRVLLSADASKRDIKKSYLNWVLESVSLTPLSFLFSLGKKKKKNMLTVVLTELPL